MGLEKVTPAGADVCARCGGRAGWEGSIEPGEFGRLAAVLAAVSAARSVVLARSIGPGVSVSRGLMVAAPSESPDSCLSRWSGSRTVSVSVIVFAPTVSVSCISASIFLGLGGSEGVFMHVALSLVSPRLPASLPPDRLLSPCVLLLPSACALPCRWRSPLSKLASEYPFR
ncbi:hypothetical protein RSOL_361060 [Rhizoctonia solani AG-3 Rhs1AP]|uniref:Uncharacterized protein n=2 Tax=Rhizoctonia solani AG-3 TaxID=1086053 RepID=A0A074RS08_9AGAM|nr:hypothetical protein RSOL_361060 [Rhizoctonia solani AG-3 Rhs1AP]KEP47478.1 hypothetical protein V565_154240 [Rhizoctonia solani 123E]